METDRNPDPNAGPQVDANPIADDTTPEDLDKTLADSFPASDPPARP